MYKFYLNKTTLMVVIAKIGKTTTFASTLREPHYKVRYPNKVFQQQMNKAMKILPIHLLKKGGSIEEFTAQYPEYRL